jgi:N-acetylglucosaminyl-diphospho-decaprenol L-rhamnosyltransferase
MELSIIYVNWNSLDYLQNSIASVYEFTRATTFEIVVVDNASPEGGIDSIRNSFPEVMVIKSDKNLGFAGANNLGFQNSRGEYILLLNPDTKFFEPSIDVMMGYIKKLPDAGIVGCKLLNTDLSVQLSSIQKFPTILNQIVDAEYLRHRWPHSPLWGIAPLFEKNITSIPVDVIPGACMLLRRKVFEEIGCYSEDYFMYAEDIDLNYKIANHGHRNYYVGETAIIHHGGRSSAKQRVNHWATIMKYKAMVLYFRKTRGSFYEWRYRAAVGSVAVLRVLLLMAMMPFGNVLWDKESLSFSFDKWQAVLKWALANRI